MLGKIAKLLLVLTSVAPVLLTYAFIEVQNSGFSALAISLVCVTALLVFICWGVIRGASEQLEDMRFSISSVKSADSEIVGFVLVYLLPLINTTDVTVNVPVLLFVLSIFVLVVWTSNAYHFNPLLGMFGFRFYEVTSATNITYLMITRKDIRSASSVKKAVQLTEYIVLDADKE